MPLNWYQEQQQRQEEDLRLRAANMQQRDPSRSERILNMTGITALPPEVVDSDLDNIESRVRASSFDVDEYRKDNPIWTSFAAENPYHLSVLEEDFKNMGAIERAWTQRSLGYRAGRAQVRLAEIQNRRMAGDKQPNDEQTMAHLRQLLEGGDFGAENLFVRAAVETARMTPMITGAMKFGVYRAQQAIPLGMATGAGVGAMAGGVGSGPGAIVGGGAGLTAGMLTGAAEFSFDVERGLAYDEYLEMGFSEEDSRWAANSMGAVAASLETIGFNAITKYIPGFRQARGAIARQITGSVLGKPSVRQATAVFASRYGAVLGTEVGTEILQEAAVVAGGEYLKATAASTEDVAPMTWDQFTDRVAAITVQTLLGASAFSLIGPGSNYYSDVRSARQAQEDAMFWNDMVDGAEASTTRENLPPVYKAFQERLQRDGPVQKVMIDVERFTEYFQGVNEDPNQVAKDLGIDLQEARMTGVDIEIPLAVFNDKMAGSGHARGLLPDIKSNEGQMSLREAEAFFKNEPSEMKRVREMLAPESPVPNQEIYDAMLGELQDGYETSAAEKQARLTAAIFTVTAERNGLDPVALFKERLGGVSTGIPSAFSGRDIDINIDPLLDRLRAGDIPTQRSIFGPSLREFLTERGGVKDLGGELRGRDYHKQFRGLVRDSGDTPAGAAEVAAEAGFIAEADENLLFEALDREGQGQAVYPSSGALPDAGDARALLSDLDSLERAIEEQELDIQGMTNEEIRAALAPDREFFQDEDITEINKLTEQALSDPAVLEAAEAVMPERFGRQTFGDLTFTEPRELAGEEIQVTQSYQAEWNRQNKRRNVLKKLLECARG